MSTRYTEMCFLRASVSDVCNLNCVYCPKPAGMENYVPAGLRGRRLALDDFCEALHLLSKLGFQGLCITGGEPTANPHLPEILERSRAHFEALELTSNGFKLTSMLGRIAHLLDRVKISIDSPDEAKAAQIAQIRGEPLAPAMRALVAGLEAGVSMTVNTVVMRSNIRDLLDLISRLTSLAEQYPGRLSHSLYDVYYTPTRRRMWEQEFVPTFEIERLLTETLGEPHVSGEPDRRFVRYASGHLPIVFKDTFGATPRAPLCASCPEPCQEGVCSLRLSVEGWVTACPSGSSSLGAQLSPCDGVTPQVADIADRVRHAHLEAGTFERMVSHYNLHPRPD